MSAKPSREYNSPLRQAQAAQTRELILQALIDLVLTGRQDASVREIAAEAGVSERTVYRYFPDRDALLNGLDDWLVETMASAPLEESLERADDLDELLQVTTEIFDRFDDVADLVRAAVILEPDPARPTDGRRRRTKMIEGLVQRSFPELHDRDRTRLVALVRLLISSSTWLHLRGEFGLPGRDAGVLVTWALALIFEDVGRHGGIAASAAGTSPAS